ncbi:hypothetical protein SEA_ZENTENO07_66 [Mycobacterium phage Zenteno07]|nr:hypothetical protein SEA_ZENTENO07_66 [Mycobacterium phage Zenteno07]
MATRRIPAMPNWTIKAVQTISGDDIGRLIRLYDWDADHEVATIKTGELRQISHNQAETTLIFGTGAEIEHTFQNGEPVSFDPPLDYTDVPELRQAFYDFHGIENRDTL